MHFILDIVATVSDTKQLQLRLFSMYSTHPNEKCVALCSYPLLLNLTNPDPLMQCLPIQDYKHCL